MFLLFGITYHDGSLFLGAYTSYNNAATAWDIYKAKEEINFHSHRIVVPEIDKDAAVVWLEE
jgi:hypothetical protein